MRKEGATRQETAGRFGLSKAQSKGWIKRCNRRQAKDDGGLGAGGGAAGGPGLPPIGPAPQADAGRGRPMGTPGRHRHSSEDVGVLTRARSHRAGAERHRQLFPCGEPFENGANILIFYALLWFLPRKLNHRTAWYN